MTSLSDKQQKFVFLVSQLIAWAYGNGYRMTFGEAYRTPEQAAINAQKGTGIANSLHTKRLAVDLNLFKDGQYLTKTEDYATVGEYWESLDHECAWGGRFRDGNHFSLSHEGVK